MRIPRARGIAVSVTVLAAFAVCFVSHDTPLFVCAGNAFGWHPSHGSLAAVPSDVPALSLDSMRWRVSSGPVDLGVATTLEFRGQIVASAPTSLSGIGVLFESVDQHGNVTRRVQTMFTDMGRGEQANEVVSFDSATPNSRAPIWMFAQHSGLRPDPGWGCPQRARVVRLSSLAADIGLTEAVARDTARLFAERRAPTAILPVEVLVDSSVPADFADNVAIGVAVNTTSDTIRGVIAWIAVETDAPTEPPAEREPARDTIVFPLDPLPPHALVPFGGVRLDRYTRAAHGAWLSGARPRLLNPRWGERIGARSPETGERAVPGAPSGARRYLPLVEPYDLTTLDLGYVAEHVTAAIGLFESDSSRSTRSEFVVGAMTVAVKHWKSGNTTPDTASFRLTVAEWARVVAVAESTMMSRTSQVLPSIVEFQSQRQQRQAHGDSSLLVITLPHGVIETPFVTGTRPPGFAPLFALADSLRRTAQSRERSESKVAP